MLEIDRLQSDLAKGNEISYPFLYVFYPIWVSFGGGGGGAPKGAGAQPAHAVFKPWQLKNVDHLA